MKNIFTFSIVLLLLCGVFGDEVKLSVMEGDSVTLHTNLTDIQKGSRIKWTFGEGSESLLVHINENKISNVDESFRVRLQVNNQTGDLTITNMKIKHSGRYQAEIISQQNTTHKTFRVTVNEPPRFLGTETCDVKLVLVMKEKSVTLHTDVQTHRDDLILWRFGNEGLLIAKYDKEDNKNPEYDEERFRGRLKLDHQTGSLNITNITITDFGLYKLKMSSNSKQTLYKTFNPYLGGPQFSVAVVVTYVVLLFLSFLVMLAISVYQSHHKTSGLGWIIGDKRGIRVVIFHFLVKVLLVLLMLLLLSVVTYSYIMTLDLKKMDDKSSTSLAVIFGVLQTLLFLTVIKVFRRISQQKQRGICSGVLCLLLVLLLMLIVVIYTVGFVDLKHMEAHMAKVYVILLVLMVLGGIYHFSESICLKLIKVKITLVFEGESLILPTGFTELQSDDVIQLSFENEVIAEFNKNNKISSDDERFRDRLKVDVQTGSLIIRNIRTEDAGLYKVKMSSSSKVKSFLQFIISRGQSYYQFNVIVKDSESESVMVVLNEAEDNHH